MFYNPVFLSFWSLVGFQNSFPQTNRFGRDFDQFVVGDKFQRVFVWHFFGGKSKRFNIA